MIINEYLRQLDEVALNRQLSPLEEREAGGKAPLKNSLPPILRRTEKFLIQPQQLVQKTTGKLTSPMKLISYPEGIWKKDGNIEKALLGLGQNLSL